MNNTMQMHVQIYKTQSVRTYSDRMDCSSVDIRNYTKCFKLLYQALYTIKLFCIIQGVVFFLRINKLNFLTYNILQIFKFVNSLKKVHASLVKPHIFLFFTVSAIFKIL